MLTEDCDDFATPAADKKDSLQPLSELFQHRHVHYGQITIDGLWQTQRNQIGVLSGADEGVVRSAW